MKVKFQVPRQTAACILALSAITAFAGATPEDSSKVESSRTFQGKPVTRASEIIGMEVKNLKDEALGKVEELAVNIETGRIVAVVVSSGGFLGINGEVSAVAPAALSYSEDRKSLRLDVTKDTLGKAPHFKSDAWPDLSKKDYVGTVYSAYNLDPESGLAPDNTGRNVRDREDRTLTPEDQGGSQADIEMTARIRREVIAAENLSASADNVKIITTQGKVTLRGPVATEEEKRVVEEIAMRAAGGAVENQLEIVQVNESADRP